MPVRTHFNRILAAARDGALILTVNKRLSRHLRTLYDRWLVDGGETIWDTPDILPLEAWWHRTAEALGLDGALLDRNQALRLWETVIETDLAGRGHRFLQVPAAAEKAMEAHRLLQEYDAWFSPEEGAEDHRAFLRWRRAWEDRCRELGVLDPGTLPKMIVAAMEEGRFAPPRQALLVGFDEIGPGLGKALEALRRGGCKTEVVPPLLEPRGEATRVPCADSSEEVRKCARWAGRLLAEGAEEIGVVVAGLAGYGPLIARIFREELDPAAVGSGEGAEGLFSLSLGTPLANEGMIAAALDILALDAILSPEQIDFLLRSPFVTGAGAEQDRRALLDRERRQAGVETVGLTRLVRWARQGFLGSDPCPSLAQVLSDVEPLLKERRSRLPGAWAEHFARLLAALGWPGSQGLDSRDYQLVRAWRELTAKFASLDAVSHPLEKGAALGILRRLAAKEIFQVEGPPGRIQVMGHLEAAGLRFDHLWLMGLHEEALPFPPQPNPFLPLPLQKERGMPHAGAERELDFARNVAARLLAAAPTIRASYPGQREGSESRPSPFIRELPAAEAPLAPLRRPTIQARNLPAPLERIRDPQAPSLSVGEEISGGTDLLKDQALCPFRAFARHRLSAQALAVPSNGIDARTRGILVHAALELFWQRTGDSVALQRMAEAERSALIEQCLDEALGAFEERRGELLPAAWRRLEAGCLGLLLAEWIALEAERPSFTVAERETRHVESVGGMTIRTRVDRIDELADGTRIILDYKTGRPNLRDCLGDPLLEPQLPLYAVGEQSGTVGAVAFAAVRRGECAFRGVAREENALPGVSALARTPAAVAEEIGDWPGLLERWRDALHGLGEDFAAGRAAVAPVDVQKACATCDLQPFCRVAERDEAPDREDAE